MTTTLTWPGLNAQPLLSALCQSEVEFVVFGSVARVLRGDSGRQPHDLDIAPERSEEDLKRLTTCLNGRPVSGNTVPGFVPQPVMVRLFQEPLGQGSARRFLSPFGWIEVCLKTGVPDTYADLQPNATAMSVGGDTVLVASLADLDRYDADRPAGRGGN